MLSFAIGAKAIEWIINYVSNLEIFKTKLSETAQQAQFLNDAIAGTEYTKAISSVEKQTENIKLAKEGYISTKDALQDYNKELGSSLGYTNDINEAERLLIQKGEAYIKLTLLKATAQLALADASKKQLDLLKHQNDNTDANAENTDGTAFDNLSLTDRIYSAFAQDDGKTQKLLEDGKDKKLRILKDDYDKSKVLFDNLEKQAAEFAKDNKLNFEGNEKNPLDTQKALAKQLQTDGDALANEEISLQNRIRQFKEKSSTSKLDPDQEGLTKISDSFSDVKDQINKANLAYDNFLKKHKQSGLDAYNANPANKTKLTKTDPDTLAPVEDIAITNQANLNENKYIQQDIENKKKLYAEYTAYKESLGKEAADKEYADLLLSGKDFKEYLGNLEKSVPADDLSGPIQERKDLIYKAEKENNLTVLAALKDRLAKVSEATQTAANKEKQDEEKYQVDLALLREKYTGQELATRESDLAANHAKELAATRQLALQETALYRDAMKDVTNDSLDELNKRIAEAQKALSGANLTPVQRELAKAKMDNAESELNKQGYHHDQFGQLNDDLDQTAKKAKEIQAYADATASSFHELGASLAPFDAGLSDTLNTIGDIAGVAGNAAGAVASFASGDIVGGVQKAISAIAGVFNIFAAARESARKAAAELQAYQDSLIKGQIAYNELMRDQARTQGDITQMTITELKARQELLKTQTSSAQADYNTLLAKIQSQGQEVDSESTQKYGGFLGIGRKTKVVQQTSGVGNDDYDQLLKLYTEGKLTDSTKTWFEELQKVHDEMGTITDDAKAVADQLAQAATGTTANAIASAIMDGFKAGKRTVADFADDFATLMQNAGLSFFESEVVNKKIAEFYDQFAAASEGGLTADKIAALKAAYEKDINDLGSQFTALTKIVGDPAITSASSTSLTGAIKGITADQANVLTGSINGFRLTQLDTNVILRPMGKGIQDGLVELRNQTLLQIKIENNTKRTADNTDKMVDSLNLIGRNQGDNLNQLLKAFGK